MHKEPGITSSQLVQKIKKKLNIDKLGHTGTLDKFAEGLLILPAGKATFFSDHFLKLDKTYHAQLELGISTLSGDPESEICEKRTQEELDLFWENPQNQISLESELKGLIHWKEQEAPKISALKWEGRRYSDLTREGIETPQKSRRIQIFNSSILDWKIDSLWFSVDVSSGTYIRQIAIDIGIRMGFPARLKSLIRTKVGNFHLDQAKKVDDLTVEDHKPISDLLSYPKIVLSLQLEKETIFHGRKIPHLPIETLPMGTFFLVDAQSQLLAVCSKIEKEDWKFLRVFH